MAIKAFRLDLTPERAVELAASLDDLVTRALNHPTISTPLAAGLESTTPWLAQTYVPAEPLDGALRQFGPAPLAHVVTIVTHLAGALDFAAATGVLHGSLHPRDVLVSPGETFLIDTGVAPALERCGIRTPVRRPYSAPERVDGAAASRAADVFALAAIAFELLTGQPIAGAGDASLAQLPEIPGADASALEAAFAAALALDPGARPAAALTFAASVKAALGAAGFRHAPAVAPRRSQRTTPMLPLDAPAPAEGPAATEAAPIGVDASHAAEAPAAGVPAAAVPPDAPAAVAAEEPRVDVAGVDHERPPSEFPPPVAERPRYADLTEPTAPSTPGEPAADRFRQPHTPVTPPTRVQPVTRSMPVAVLLVVLAAALTGFGVGWLWSAWGGAPAASPTQQATGAADGAPSGERGSIVPADGEVSDGAVTASSGVEPDQTLGDAAAVDPPAPPEEVPPAAEPPAAAPAAEPPAPSAGRLLVRSTPAGAAVQVDGRSRGRTPLTLRDLPFGSHTVVVSRPGYETQRRTLRLTPDRTSQSLEVSLRETTPAPSRTGGVYTGSMVVESRPRDARVMLDGEPVGRTPLTLRTVRAGSHVVRIEMDGYRTWTASVRVVAGERNRVTASLEQMR